MPTFFRLLSVIAILAALVWGAMEIVATYLTPQPREITRDIDLSPKR